MKRPFNPRNPMESAYMGMYHHQTILNRQYSIYLPACLEQDVPCVMIAPPDEVSAEGFASGEIGQGWKTVADENGIALVFVEPEQGGAWKIQTAEGLRAEIHFIHSLLTAIRFPSKSLEAPFSMSERSFYMVGYQAGATALAAFALQWPAYICGFVSVDGTPLPPDSIQKIGGKLCYPFVAASGNLSGRDENALQNRSVPVSAWFIRPQREDLLPACWITALQGCDTSEGEFAKEFSARNNAAARIWITEEAGFQAAPRQLYHHFLAPMRRIASVPGGMPIWSIPFINDGKTGFFLHEEQIDGKLRRWATYLPQKYYEIADSVPLVFMLHGFTSSWQSVAEVSDWHKLADEIGFVVVYPSAYVSDIPLKFLNSIRTTAWNSYAYQIENLDDVSFLREVKKRIQEQLRIDSSRIYLAGHSNGCQMAFRVAGEAPALFAAIAAVGSTIGGYDATLKSVEPNPVPIWLIKTEYDGSGGALFDDPESYNVKTIRQWIKRNGCDDSDTIYGVRLSNHSTHAEPYGETTIWTDSITSTPLLRYTTFPNLPHAYTAEMTQCIWNDFFQHYTINADGTHSWHK